MGVGGWAPGQREWGEGGGVGSRAQQVGDLPQHVAEAAKGMAHEDVKVRVPRLDLIPAHRVVRDDEDLIESPRGTLAQLIGRMQSNHRPDHVLALPLVHSLRGDDAGQGPGLVRRVKAAVRGDPRWRGTLRSRFSL